MDHYGMLKGGLRGLLIGDVLGFCMLRQGGRGNGALGG